MCSWSSLLTIFDVVANSGVDTVVLYTKVVRRNDCFLYFLCSGNDEIDGLCGMGGGNIFV